MKIAVIFLLLGISSFIETSSGLVSRLKPLDQNKVQYHVRWMQAVSEKVGTLQKCPEEERKTRESYLVEELIHNLNVLSIDLECTFIDILKLLELPLNILELIQLNKITELLNAIHLDKLLFSVCRLLEGVLAQVNLVLKNEILNLSKILRVTTNLDLLSYPLHDTIGQIVTVLSGTPLGSILSLVNAPLKLVPLLG